MMAQQPQLHDFADLINNEELSDVCFHVSTSSQLESACEEQKTLFYSNRGILALKSPVFKAMLFGHMKEAICRTSDEPIEIEDLTSESFMNLLQYIHTSDSSKVLLTQSSIIPTLYAAIKYQLDNNGLPKICSEWLSRRICCRNVCFFLAQTVKYPIGDEFVGECLQIILDFGHRIIQTEGWQQLSRNQIGQIIQHDEFVVGDEKTLFLSCIKWAEYQCEILHLQKTPENLRNLMAPLIRHIRFPLMNWRTIGSLVVNSQVVPDRDIVQIINYLSKGTEKSAFSSHPRLSPLTFTYKTDFDKNGLLYYIGQQNSENRFKNPHLTDKIKISMSSFGVGTRSNFVSRCSLPTWTENTPNSYIQIDLKTGLLAPMHYTLRHGGETGATVMRHWVFEGSCDGENWRILDERKNDETLSSVNGWSTGTWRVFQEIRCRLFRVRQTGKNFNGNDHLVLCAIELYGKWFPVIY